MFEKLLKELKKLEQNKISIPVEKDEDGYVDRECPNDECLYQFKVHEEDWINNFKDEAVFCPMCRHEATSDNWWTTEQINFAKGQAEQIIKSKINNALIDGANDFNRKQNRKSFISLKITTNSRKSNHITIPIPSMEEMQLKITCEKCNSRYAVVGSAFFCPCCGHNSANETFDNSINKIKAKIKNLPTIRKAVEEISKDEAETTCRSLIESSLSECVVAFQRFCEITFSTISPETKIKFNAFQNLEIGAKYWSDLYNETYSDWIDKDEYFNLNILFQKRHLLSHTEGIVDSKYIEKSGDSNYKVGQRIIVKESDVLQLIEIIQKIVKQIRSKT
jgi:hypothetical protein